MTDVPLPAEVRLALRLPGDLHKRLTALAETDHRSLNAEIIVMLYAVLPLFESRAEADKMLRRYGEDHGASPPDSPIGGVHV
jgi:hypothetical protein